jgi:hypothetical protein
MMVRSKSIHDHVGVTMRRVEVASRFDGLSGKSFPTEVLRKFCNEGCKEGKALKIFISIIDTQKL